MMKETKKNEQIKNLFIHTVSLALLGVIICIAACSTTGTSNRASPATSVEPATLTITGLDKYVGNYIVARMIGDGKDNIVATADIGTESYYGQGYPAIGGLIENGSITLPVWEITSEGDFDDSGERVPLYTHEKAPYTGNNTLSLSIDIWEKGPGIFTGLTHQYNSIAICAVTVTFNNGSAKIAFVPDEEWERLRKELE
jgi:hypothetical protein